MWKSRNKTDLIIEVWEKLDCESVGAAEIEAIETAVLGRFGASAVDSPMVTARLLADEGAELRHSEIMELYLKRHSDQPYEPALRGILDTSSLKTTLRSLKNAENLQKKYQKNGDREGQRLLREKLLQAKKDAQTKAASKVSTTIEKQTSKEIAHWLTLWLQSPEVFDNWIRLRRESKEFVEIFGRV
jgi:hypothetical protein